jgi:hypothetical protein
MNQLLVGLLIVIVGVVVTTVGGYIAKDGWEERKKRQKPAEPLAGASTVWPSPHGSTAVRSTGGKLTLDVNTIRADTGIDISGTGEVDARVGEFVGSSPKPRQHGEKPSAWQITPASIYNDIQAARPLQREAVAKAFIGLRVRWDVVFNDAQTSNEDTTSLFFKPAGDTALSAPTVICRINPNRARELQLLDRGAIAHVEGTIISVENSIVLTDAVITPK